MVFELPDNLHPDCAPIAWLLGTWRGNGHGDYPTIEKFQYAEELIFTHDGRPFFHYFSRTWLTDDSGERLRDALRKAGREPEWVVYPGEAHGWRLERNQVDFAQRLERFLAEHLPAPGVATAR